MYKFKCSCILFTLCFLMPSLIAQAQSLKVMTYNIRLDVASDGENAWPLRKDFFTSQIQFYEPDVFGVQEAKPNQVIDIAEALNQYNKVGIAREGEGKGESSNIFYKKNRFILKQTNTFWLSNTPDTISKGWDAAFNRVCTYVLLKDKQTHKTFWVFNTHLDHIGEVARTKSIELILSKIAALNSKNYPVIVMGDFNSEPDTERIIALKKVMNDTRTVSIEKPFGPFGTFNDFKHNQPVTKLIDYIFISKNNQFKVQKHAVLSDSKDLKYPSDHLPVFVILNFNKKSTT
ncbi:MAG: endonuclease/exonuclease/phosphatase [Flavobacteriales bacterium CG03_land_8_20_14_0_80_35_15]|nr:endonuclease/exonuclease/phosphatase family protein [Zetaproteobacteria bacterium]OIO10099.1 MAG: endonuclease/exonuclease/phosphatase [Flavobacteriaceae bacterium CG1_02_35_72]PIV16975.1 MAG: endonuclease/exonuclease/phosphatase [Flavobacteriales bacterium CG03_land_8_20_14_0_80_35_15]PJA07014.1 MAG: endonuclease/exonuclease/phosphatase [Flavobacteriales bacterium CG_4_10_14_0_2_um_filter_35_18]